MINNNTTNTGSTPCTGSQPTGLFGSLFGRPTAATPCGAAADNDQEIRIPDVVLDSIINPVKPYYTSTEIKTIKSNLSDVKTRSLRVDNAVCIATDVDNAVAKSLATEVVIDVDTTVDPESTDDIIVIKAPFGEAGAEIEVGKYAKGVASTVIYADIFASYALRLAKIAENVAKTETPPVAG